MKTTKLPIGAQIVLRTGLTAAQSGRLTSQINLWLRCSGTEWTCGRLKAIRQAALQLDAGNRKMAQAILRQESISYNRSTLVPKGPFGLVVHGYVSAQRPSVKRKFAALLRVYTCLRLDSLSSKQLEKAKRSINAPGNWDEDIMNQLVYRFTQMGALIAKRTSDLDRPGKSGPLVIDMARLNPTKLTYFDKELLYGSPLKDKSWGKHVQSLWTSCWIPDSLKGINPAEEFRQSLVKTGANNVNPGKITFLQEGGCKARVVATPNVWCQLLFYPLHQYLDKVTKRVFPTSSCVHDQNKGSDFIRKALNSGEKLYCFDLSSATDRFPRALQNSLLRGMGLGYYAEAFQEISTAKWKACNGEDWKYAVGQPMGLYSSFPLFHLSHLVLLNLINNVVKKKFPNEGSAFRVLGDDVIIIGKHLAYGYQKYIEGLGVQLSDTKCFASNRFCEFAGFEGHWRPSQGSYCFRPLKWSKADGSGASIHMLYAFGTRGNWRSKKLAKEADLLSKTMSLRYADLSPIISFADDDSKPKVNLDSHWLGSLSNELGYSLKTAPPDDVNLVDETWRIHRFTLVGDKEKLFNGYARKIDNMSLAEGHDPNKPVSMARRAKSEDTTVTSDPLLNRIGSREDYLDLMNFYQKGKSSVD